MNNAGKGWMIFLAAIGMMAGLMAVEIGEMDSWAYATTPQFVGAFLAHFGVVVGAFVGGRLLPPPEE